jgi:hypothetical protein
MCFLSPNGERKPQTHTGKDRTTSVFGRVVPQSPVGPSNLCEYQDGSGVEGDTLAIISGF